MVTVSSLDFSLYWDCLS